MATFHSALYYTTYCCSAPCKKTYHLYYGKKKNQTYQGFVQSLIVLMVGELNT